jgi:hypothetical protein
VASINAELKKLIGKNIAVCLGKDFLRGGKLIEVFDDCIRLVVAESKPKQVYVRIDSIRYFHEELKE